MAPSVVAISVIILFLSGILSFLLRRKGIVYFFFLLILSSIIVWMIIDYGIKNERYKIYIPIMSCIFGVVFQSFIFRRNTHDIGGNFMISGVNKPERNEWELFRKNFKSEWRYKAILASIATSTIFTIAFHFVNEEKNEGFFSSFYVSWLSSYFFFIVAGIVSIVVTLIPPHNDTIEARIRILFGNKTLPVSMHHVEQLKMIALYAEHIDRKIVIESYNYEIKSFKAKVERRTIFVNSFNDIPITGKIPLRIVTDGIQDANGHSGEIVSAVLDGSKNLMDARIFDASGVDKNWDENFLPGGKKELVVIYWIYMKYDELQEFMTPVVARKITTLFQQEFSNRNLRLQYRCKNGKESNVNLLRCKDFILEEVHDAWPDSPAMDFKLTFSDSTTTPLPASSTIAVGAMELGS